MTGRQCAALAQISPVQICRESSFRLTVVFFLFEHWNAMTDFCREIAQISDLYPFYCRSGLQVLALGMFFCSSNRIRSRFSTFVYRRACLYGFATAIHLLPGLG
jgi:hypothetical protein